MIGNGGDDLYYVDESADTIIEDFDNGTDSVISSANYVLSDNVENLTLVGSENLSGTGNNLNNILLGNVGDNYLSGKEGNDTIEGATGNDILDGGAGDDTFIYNLNDGLDTIIDSSGEDTLHFTDGFSLENVALRVTDENGQFTAHVRILNQHGCEQQDQGFDFDISVDDKGNYVSPIEHFTFADGSTKTFDDLLIKTQVTYASFFQKTIETGRNDDIIYGSLFTNFIDSGTGNDIIYGKGMNDKIYAQGGNDLVFGGVGDNTIDGGCGIDILDGESGDDTLIDTLGNNALLGGYLYDTITAGDGNDFIAGGKQNDVIFTGGGNNVIAINTGDGKDIILPGTNSNNTLSLGNSNEKHISLSKCDDNLILDAGCNTEVIFKDWYADTENQNFNTLQFVSIDKELVKKGNGFFGLPNCTLENKLSVDTFDFKEIVKAFDASRDNNPRMRSWNIMNALLDSHLESSDSTALGGDLTVGYTKDGDLHNVALGSAQDTLKSHQFGLNSQTVSKNTLAQF